MDRSPAIGRLGAQLDAAASSADWDALERAAQAGAVAAAGLQARMDEMRDNKEGWMAYALAGATEPGENVR